MVPTRRGPRLRPDLPGGRKRKARDAGQTGDPEEDERGAMRGRGDDRRHRPQPGETGRKRRGFGDQGAWH